MAEGEFALIPQHLEAALRQSPVLVRWGSAASDLDLYILYAEFAAQQNGPELMAHALRALEAAVSLGHPLYEAIARRALGAAHRRAGAWAEADSYLSQALAQFQAMPARWQAARTLVERAKLEQDRGNTAQARAAAEMALSEFRALGAARDAASIAEGLRRL
jgi:ATP/maltotriose-dependent transcriptional regulator MalT